MLDNDSGINKIELSGFVGKYITMFETKNGSPAIKFQLYTGVKPFSFWQNCIVYGARGIWLSKVIEEGDLVMIIGKLQEMKSVGANGISSKKKTIVSKHCYILEKKEVYEKRISKDA